MAVFLLLLPKKISRETVIAIIVLRLYPYRKKIQTYMHTEHWILKHQLTDIKAVNQQPNISKQTGRKHTCELCDFQHMFPLNSQNNDKKNCRNPLYPQSIKHLRAKWPDPMSAEKLQGLLLKGNQPLKEKKGRGGRGPTGKSKWKSQRKPCNPAISHRGEGSPCLWVLRVNADEKLTT